METIVLTTLNAKFVHASFGLRYLYANMGPLQAQTRIEEFDINTPLLDIAERILSLQPRIVGFGVYIWNVRETLELVTLLKRVQPSLVIVLGGPEVSHETETQSLTALADHVICGEADLAFAELSTRVLAGEAAPHVLRPELPALEALRSPYDAYDARDVAHRVIYVEASRGCPFSCEFCLSSLDEKVRQFPLEPFLAEMDRLFQRGVRQFKFVDRTFNLQIETSRRILQFFLDRYEPGLFVHFEMIPDRLPAQLREIIAAFPPGVLQFEVGVQTLDVETEKKISRRQNHARMEENFRWLASTGVHVHADLIIGLPGEDMATFAAGFDRLRALQPGEIQVGVLKRLRGTPITRYRELVYAAEAPYEILQSDAIDFFTLQRMKRFARYWDIFCNSGNFKETFASMTFARFMAFSDWLYRKIGKQWGIALTRQYELVWEYLDDPTQAGALMRDYLRSGRRDHPTYLLQHLSEEERLAMKEVRLRTDLPKRQARHFADA